MTRSLIAALLALALSACAQHSDATASAHACSLVQYWADSTGEVADPDEGATSVAEVNDLARAGWPNDATTASKFVQLYDDMSSDMTDAEYAAEASAFEAANCS